MIVFVITVQLLKIKIFDQQRFYMTKVSKETATLGPFVDKPSGNDPVKYCWSVGSSVIIIFLKSE